MSEHDDLELLELVRARTQEHDLEHAAERQVAERPEHEATPRWAGQGGRLYGAPHIPEPENVEAPTGHDRSGTEPTQLQKRAAAGAIVDRFANATYI